jgi:hypothetical protein
MVLVRHPSLALSQPTEIKSPKRGEIPHEAELVDGASYAQRVHEGRGRD